MKNYLKMTLILLGLLFAVTQVSAYSYNSNYISTDRFSYSEDLEGGSRGFSIIHSAPRTNPSIGCDYYDWTSDFRKCRRTAYYNGHMEDYYAYYGDYNDRYDTYDENKVVKEAFKTYQQSSKQQYQLESQRLSLANRRYYGGYGSGYSGVRYYSYGW